MTNISALSKLRRRARRLTWYHSVAIIALGVVPGHALAQETTNTANPATEKPATEKASEDIVVTASKFGSALAKAPVTVVSLSQLAVDRAHIISTKDLAVSVPGIEVHSQGLFSQTYIRGIGTNAATAGVESPVATYIDGVYLQRQAGSVVDLVDVESVDVLKGPQGTLYGRNATGGAILIQTANPKNKFEGFIAGEYGNFDQYRLQAVVNIPISDTLAIRVAAQARRNGNYLRQVGTGEGRGEGDAQTLRFKVKWDPTPAFSAIYAFEYYNAHDTSFQQRQLVPAPLCTACVLDPSGVTLPNRGFYTSTTSPGNYSNNRLYSNTLTLHYETDSFNVTSITGNRNQKTPFITDLDFTPAQYFVGGIEERGPTFTNDTYLRTTLKSPLNALIGASYLRERDHQTFQFYGDILNIFGIPTGPGHNVNQVNIDSYSVYGELSYAFGNGFKLTGGARYNKDIKKIHATNDATSLALFGLNPATATSFDRKAIFNSVTPRAVLGYQTGGGYYYASYNRGEKSGAFPSPLSDPTSLSAKPEVLDNFEIGAKNTFLGGRAHTTASVFYGKYKDIQVTVSDQSKGAVILTNAASATLKGAEFTGDVTLVAKWNLGVGVTYLDNKFGTYTNAAVFAPPGTTFPGVTCPASASSLGLASCREDLSHTRLPSSPRWSGFVKSDYTISGLPDDWSARLSASAQFTSSYDFTAGAGGPLNLDRQKAYTKVNADLTFMSPDGKLEFGAFVTNLFREHYYGFISSGNNGAYGVPSMPRTFGVRAKSTF